MSITAAMCMRLESLGFSEGLAQKLAVDEANGTTTKGRSCPALWDDEIDCDRSSHRVIGPKEVWRDCRLALYRSERRRLASKLDLCGYSESADEIQQPIGPTLWRGIDHNREVKSLRAELVKVSEYKQRGWKRAGHIALIGDTGTVKTHVLFALYFAALWDGVSAWYLTTADLRKAAKDLDSHNERIAHDAEYIVAGWQQKKLLVLDDLGDRLTDQRMSREPGSTRAAALLLDLLNGHSGKRMFASNLADDGLGAHPDVGERAVSRLFSDHRMELKNHSIDIQPCMIISLYGEDQRQHLLTKQAKGIGR